MNELANPTEAKLVLQRFLLQDALHLETSATDRLSDLIQAMLETSQNCLEQSQNLQFPSQMLPLPGCILASSIGFEHQNVFSDRPEFSQSDLTAIQAELAHARREIEHLHREIGQLEAELGQAHEIFDQIQNHPIAGPVIRTREKITGLALRSEKNEPVQRTRTTS